jgi:hypothetical protein
VRHVACCSSSCCAGGVCTHARLMYWFSKAACRNSGV